MAIAAALAGGALIGGVGSALLGGGPDVSAQRLPFEREFQLRPEGRLEALGRQTQFEQLGALGGLVGAGPGRQDVTAAFGAQRGLAEQFQAAQFGLPEDLLPTQADITRTTGIAEQLFAPQRVGLQQAFEQAQTRTQREAARLGRPTSDPILQARLQREQLQAQERLGARVGARAQELALDQPRERLALQRRGLELAGARSEVLGGLATQALQNRQTLLGLGSGIQAAERQFRIATAKQTGFGTQLQETPSTGQRIGAALTGGLAGATAGLGIARGFQGLSSPGPSTRFLQ